MVNPIEIKQALLEIRESINFGRTQEALKKCHEALALNTPLADNSALQCRAEIYGLQGDLFQEKGDLDETIAAYLNSIKLNSSNQEIWIKFANVIKYVQFHSYSELIKQVITSGLARSGICHQHFALPAISLLKLAPSYNQIFASLDSKIAFQQISEKLASGNFKLLEDKLFVRLLEKTLLPDHGIEKFLTFIRKALLKKFAKDHFLTLPTGFIKFIYALSRNCFYNEFLYEEDESEGPILEKLFHYLNAPTDNLLEFKTQTALFGCYRPLHKVPFAARLIEIANMESDPEFLALIQEQVVEPQEEEWIFGQIPLFKSISDAVSIKVSSQYEENPYPRWKSLDKTNPKSNEPFEMLIAGCGTGQHAITSAISYPNAHILAIDFSKNSLAYAIRKADELKISNIAFLQADLLDLEALNRTFDLIESVGVLHHLEDPVRGWRILTQLLKSQGRMEIGLYSEIARQDVLAAKTFINTKKYCPTFAGIRQCRQAIFALSPSDPVYGLSLGLDFYSLSACRDLLFHVQEQCFTLQQISHILEELGLKFLGFEIRDKSILKKYREQFSDDPLGLSLEHWQQFEDENPQTFLGMYLFTVQKQV